MLFYLLELLKIQKMKVKILLLAVLFSSLLYACNKEKNDDLSEIKEGNGTIWLSGGLYFCAEQIRMDEGDTLVSDERGAIFQFTAGDKVHVKYYEKEIRESGCTIGKECEIIAINKID